MVASISCLESLQKLVRRDQKGRAQRPSGKSKKALEHDVRETVKVVIEEKLLIGVAM